MRGMHNSIQHRGTAIGKYDHCIALLLQTPQARLDISKALKVVILGHQRVLLPLSKGATRGGQRVVKGFARDLVKVFVMFHRRQPEGEFKLLLPPDFSDSLDRKSVV